MADFQLYIIKKGSDPHQLENKMKSIVAKMSVLQAGAILGFSFEEFIAAGEFMNIYYSL